MNSQITFIPRHAPPSKEEVLSTIGSYQIVRTIGKGGMGEVFLAYDPICGRYIALKKIRDDLTNHKKLHKRFLNEARITSQLTHPTIIPIYEIHNEDQILYYTMPYVGGETLKQILNRAYKNEKKGETDLIASIPSLLRIFINVCQAIAYAHSNQVLHRDLKPENIIVGPYGEVFILDWGLAKLFNEQEDEYEETLSQHDFTHVGKVVGTVSFMAPERARGNPANTQTDIYALGIILFQILTLRLPFNRGTLYEFRENIDKEIIPNPAEVAPYRDVPSSLIHIVNQSLAKNPKERYPHLNALIYDLENYIEGRSSWYPSAELNVHNKSDWEFQENVFIADHIAITRVTEEADWVSLMVSKASFSENIKIEISVKIDEKGHGIGILFGLPESSGKVHLNEGYCLWLGSDLNKTTKLTKSAVEVIHAPEIYLMRHLCYQVRIEKIERNVYFYLNDTLQFSYVSHLPIVGTHIGIIAKDDDFSTKPVQIATGSQNIMVNCLAIPDTFLAHKDYAKALSEYRRIGYSFPGRAEGREAIFRAGITLLEQAKSCKNLQKTKTLYDRALDEFEKLHGTPGAPLEYLGKALVYCALREYDEEIKCFELAYRRYPNHPLLNVLQEQIIYRMHESSRFNRKVTYQFVLLAVQHLPKVATSIHTKRLFKNLQKHWEVLSFIEEESLCATSKALQNTQFAIILAFWLGKPYVFIEIIEEQIKKQKRSPILIVNALFALIELGAIELAEKKCQSILDFSLDKVLHEKCKKLHYIFEFHKGHPPPFSSTGKLDFDDERMYIHIIEHAIAQNEIAYLNELFKSLKKCQHSQEFNLKLDCYRIWSSLLEKNWQLAAELLNKYSIEELNQETSYLYFLYGCWLYVTEGKEIAKIHLSAIFPITYPRTWNLLCHYLFGKLPDKNSWLEKKFLWERRKLFQQLTLFFACIGNGELANEMRQRESEEYIRVSG